MPDVVLGHYYKDLVICKYTVIGLNTGTIIEDTTNMTNMDDITIISTFLARQKNMLRFLYTNKHINDCELLSQITSVH